MRFRLDGPLAMLDTVTVFALVCTVHRLLQPCYRLTDLAAFVALRLNRYRDRTIGPELQLTAARTPIVDHPPARNCKTSSAASSCACTVCTFLIA